MEETKNYKCRGGFLNVVLRKKVVLMVTLRVTDAVVPEKAAMLASPEALEEGHGERT